MKRTTLFIIAALMAVCARAQYKSVMTVGAADADEPYQMAFNLTTVCKSLGSGREDLGHILEVWLDPNRSWMWKNEYKQYELLPLIYVSAAGGAGKMVSNTHSGFAFMADGTPCRPDTESLDSIGNWEVQVSANPELNQLNFTICVMPNPWTGQLSMRAGDTCHAVFGLEYEGQRATFDLTMQIVEGNGGNDVPLTALEKVGEGRVAMKYQAGKTCRTQLDMAAIASHFGGDVEGGNLRFYVARQGETGMLTDRYAYSEVPQFKCNEEMAEELDNENPRVAEILFSAETQHLLVNTPGAFSAGEHATGPLYLVADGKYYELVLDVQFGDSEQGTDDINEESDDYVPLVLNGKTWKMGWFDDEAETQETSYLVYHYIEGDTIVNGIRCKKMMCLEQSIEGEQKRYLAALYETEKQVFCALSGTTEFLLLYDFGAETDEEIMTFDVFRGVHDNYTIRKKTISETDTYKGKCTEISSGNYTGNWIHGIGALGLYNRTDVKKDGKQLRLMECTIGDESLYYDSSLIDGVTPPDEHEARKNRLDFSHTIKSQPKVPRHKAPDATKSLSGEYSTKEIFVNFLPLTGMYTIMLMDADGEAVYKKQVQTDNVLALNTDIAKYGAGTYTLTVENDMETYEASFTIEGTGLGTIHNAQCIIYNGIYDLSGRKINLPQPLQRKGAQGLMPKGVYIVNGKKIINK